MTAPGIDDQQAIDPFGIFQIISNFWISRAVQVFAKLGLADELKSGSKTVAELATATSTHDPSLFRLLRTMASVGLVTADNDGKFGLTSVTRALLTDIPGSLRWFTISELGQEHYPAWGNLLHSVRTGGIAFDDHFGMDCWEYFRQNPDDAAIFNDSMSGMTAAANAVLLSSYDFAQFKTVADIGGGHGGLLTSILNAHPSLSGILFDSPQVIEGAGLKLAEAGIADRCKAISGDFFAAVPAGADAYILKWIIHDWDDEKSIQILKNCREQMPGHGKLILVDCVVPDTAEPHFAKFIDLNMLVMTGGKERTEKEFAELLSAAGFKLLRVIETVVPTSIIEAGPA